MAATRILVTCRSQRMPGPPEDRIKTMVNIICQHQWQRPFDPAQDFYQSLGNYEVDCNERIFVLVDTGPAKSIEYITIVYRWKEGKLVQVPYNPMIKNALSDFPFGYKPEREHQTDEEYREIFGEKKYGLMMEDMIRNKWRWGETWLSDNEKAYLEAPKVSEIDKTDKMDKGDKLEHERSKTTMAEETENRENADSNSPNRAS